MAVNFFIYLQKPNIFVERLYQLKNFDMNFKGCHLGCLVYQISTYTTKFRTHTRKLVASYLQGNEIFGIKSDMCVVSLPVGQQHGTAHEISERVRETNKIKIVAAAFLDGITRK